MIMRDPFGENPSEVALAERDQPVEALSPYGADQPAHSNPYVERLIGSVRRECLDHVIVFNHRHLRRTLTRYLSY